MNKNKQIQYKLEMILYIIQLKLSVICGHINPTYCKVYTKYSIALKNNKNLYLKISMKKKATKLSDHFHYLFEANGSMYKLEAYMQLYL